MHVNLQSDFQLEDRDIPSYIDWLETQDPNDPEVLAYRKQKAEGLQQVAETAQEDQTYVDETAAEPLWKCTPFEVHDEYM